MPSLNQLLSDLEAAVRAGDRARALELARQIQQQLARESYDRAAIERRVRELVRQSEQPGASRRGSGTFGSDIRGMPRTLHYP